MPRTPRSHFGFRLVTLARQWRRQLDNELARAGLTDASWAPLMHLAEGGDAISQTELALRVGLDGSSLVRLLDLLEKRAMIERQPDPKDRRAHRIMLTQAGRAQVREIGRRLYRIEAGLLADLDDASLRRMLDAFSRIDARIAATQEEAGS